MIFPYLICFTIVSVAIDILVIRNQGLASLVLQINCDDFLRSHVYRLWFSNYFTKLCSSLQSYQMRLWFFISIVCYSPLAPRIIA